MTADCFVADCMICVVFGVADCAIGNWTACPVDNVSPNFAPVEIKFSVSFTLDKIAVSVALIATSGVTVVAFVVGLTTFCKLDTGV